MIFLLQRRYFQMPIEVVSSGRGEPPIFQYHSQYIYLYTAQIVQLLLLSVTQLAGRIYCTGQVPVKVIVFTKWVLPFKLLRHSR